MNGFKTCLNGVLKRGQYRNMNPIDPNRDTKTKIQMPMKGGNYHVKAKQGGSDTNQVNGHNLHHTRGKTRRTEVTINS